MTDSQNSHSDRNDINTQSNDRGANVRITEEKEALVELDTQERDLLEKLAIVQRKQADIIGTRKRKHSSDNEDMKPSTSKP